MGKNDCIFLHFRPISALPVNTDVPRLCRKILVCNGETVIFDGSLKTFVNQPVNLVVKAMFGKYFSFHEKKALLIF